MQEFKLPDLGEGMQEAEIRRWLVQPGELVKLDQPMVEVETDKAVVEIPSPVSARVVAIHVPEGQVAKVGTPLLSFEGNVTKTSNVKQVAPETPAPPVATQSSSVSAKTVLAAPAVRKRAFELHIDLAQVPSSQPNGRITMPDLEAYLQRKSAEPALNGAAQLKEEAEEKRQPLTGLRRQIAERMERSWRTIPHATAFGELDGSALVGLRQELKPLAEERGVRLTYLPLLVKLLIPVLKEFPIFNATLDEERREIIYKRSFHIGIAADTQEGLMVPVLRNADTLSVIQIAQKLEDLVARAQKRALALQEVSGSTFTLNNVGSFGGSNGVPIINYPEAAILAVGRLQEQPVVCNGAIEIRPMMQLALSFDHRLIDGALAGRFLERFKQMVEKPQQLLLNLV